MVIPQARAVCRTWGMSLFRAVQTFRRICERSGGFASVQADLRAFRRICERSGGFAIRLLRI